MRGFKYLKGLIIKSPWIEYIFDGTKQWEIRGSNTKIRGKIYLIKSGSGHIYGTAEITDCIELSLEQYQSAYNMHMIPLGHLNQLPYRHTYAWILENAKLFSKPLKYKHPQGAVIWVNIESK